MNMPDMQCAPQGKEPVGHGRRRQSVSSEASSQSACPLQVNDRLMQRPEDRHYLSTQSMLIFNFILFNLNI